MSTIVDECSGQEFPDHDEQIRAKERKAIGEWLAEISKHMSFPAELRAGYASLKRGEKPEG